MARAGLPDLKSGGIPFLKILDAILGVQDAIFEFYGTTLGRVFFFTSFSPILLFKHFSSPPSKPTVAMISMYFCKKNVP